MGQYPDMESLVIAIDNHDGLLSVSMRDLREILGRGRLSDSIRDEISGRLLELNVLHYPSVLPRFQEEMVRLYKAGSVYEDATKAVLTPGSEWDHWLRRRIGGEGNNARRTIEKIRQLLEDL